MASYFDHLQSYDHGNGFLSRVRKLWKRYDIPLMVIRGHVRNAVTPWCSEAALVCRNGGCDYREPVGDA